MGMRPNNGRMEGWLYTIRSNRFGLQFSRKRYFILEENYLKFYKTIPTSQNEEPVRSAIIDSCIRITDNGRESINRKVFFIFTLYSTLNYNDQLKLGASSSEDAAGWIRSLQNAVLKVPKLWYLERICFYICLQDRPIQMLLSVSKRVDCKGLVDFYSSMHTEATTSDVIAPSPWKIFGCQNGLRLFKEAKDWDSQERVSCISLWDFCSYRGSTVEHLDGHTDIIHKQLYRDLLPRGMKRRDLLLRRYWRREDDGTYVILYHSVIHKKCPPQKGYVRACLKSGGYVITPISQGRRSIVKHMLAVNWRSWKLYILPSCEKSITIRMLERVAALRELFQAKEGNYTALSPRELTGQVVLPQTEKADVEVKAKGEGKIEEEPNLVENEAETLSASLTALNSASDEFYDVPDTNEMMDFDLENEWSSEMSPETHTASMLPPRLSSAAGKVKKKLHDFAVQKKGYMDLQESTKEDGVMCSYGATLQKDPNYTLPCSWAAADPSTFLIRGKNYLKDNEKVKAKGTLMQIVGADWLRSNRPESDLGSRPDSIVQSYAVQDRPEFFFIVNIQVPGSTMYTLALYYMLKTPLEETPLLQKFVNGDDAYRNSRFKLIPYISKGSWIVKQSVGKKACLVGQALEVHYFRGKNYLELEVDVGSSTVARGVVSLVLGYLTNLVIEMAFLIQGETEEELPEILLGTCRLNHLDATKSVLV
uniref:PH domain-containing protein n=1 Tax=Manihot esculenta TaxID=3983 RepID=A0A2C9V3D3_MANES